jgi:hypothetical protein
VSFLSRASWASGSSPTTQSSVLLPLIRFNHATIPSSGLETAEFSPTIHSSKFAIDRKPKSKVETEFIAEYVRTSDGERLRRERCDLRSNSVNGRRKGGLSSREGMADTASMSESLDQSLQ